MFPLESERPVSPHNHAPIRLFALGGLGEIGKNLYGIEYQDEIVLIDCGLKFPDARLPGVDYIVPDFRYVLENNQKIKGLFLTHGHEDHIGGIPYLLKQLPHPIPIYGAPLTLGLVQAKLQEHSLAADCLQAFEEHSPIRFQHISVEFFRTSHSIPDAFGIAVRTPLGYIVHTGDFKFDMTPEGLPPNLHKMASIGREGVLALLSDSTNSERSGVTPSEKKVGATIMERFQSCKGRILFATFASNVHRLQQVVEAAIATGRRIVILGRSMERVFGIGQELGYIRVPQGILVDLKDLSRYRDNQIAIVCTGSQGEPQAALTRIAGGSHRLVQIHDGDSVIFSSSPIPGNTQNINRSIDKLMRAGADVVDGSILDIHTSGHGYQEDLKLMLQLMKPKFFIPIHGEYRMLVKHARLAESTGVLRSNIFILKIGDVLQLTSAYGEIDGMIPSGETFVSGSVIINATPETFSDRLHMGANGVVIAIMAIDHTTGSLLSGPTLISRGFVYIRESGKLLASAESRLRNVIQGNAISTLAPKRREFIEQTLRAFFQESLERSPCILPIVIEV